MIPQLSRAARELMLDEENEVLFSTVVIWETVIKTALGRWEFKVDAQALRDELLRQGFVELTVTSEHAIAVNRLPLHHHDPFDRLLIAQAQAEGMLLLTHDRTVLFYSGTLPA